MFNFLALPPQCDENKNYKCNETSCLSLSTLCTGKSGNNDCLTTVCSQNILKCDPKTSTFCNCRNTDAGGKICHCPKGFERQGDACVDIDECKIPGICDQKCSNLPGTYLCDCYIGFKLTAGISGPEGLIQSSPSKCRAIGADPLLLLSNRAAIRQYDLVTNRYHPLVNKLDSAVAMDYWHANQTLIWSDVSKEQIMICHMNVSSEKFYECAEGADTTLIDKNISTPDGLAIDWVHGLLFWTDTGLDTVSFCIYSKTVFDGIVL